MAGKKTKQNDAKQTEVLSAPEFTLQADNPLHRRLLFHAWHQLGHQVDGDEKQLLATAVREFEIYEEARRAAE